MTERDFAAEFPAALAKGRIKFDVQPRVDLATGATVAYEALARWDHPALGRLLPEAFLPALEGAGIGSMLTDRLVAYAAMARRRLVAAGIEADMVVNLSATDLVAPFTVKRLALATHRERCDPGHVVFEASTYLFHPDVVPLATYVLRGLAAAGFRVGLDNYGVERRMRMGAPDYVDQGTLGAIPFSSVMVDRSLLVESRYGVPFVEAAAPLVEFCRSIGAVPGVMGIETQAMSDMAKSIGLVAGQGYRYGRPTPLPDHFGTAARRAA